MIVSSKKYLIAKYNPLNAIIDYKALISILNNLVMNKQLYLKKSHYKNNFL